MSNNLQISGLFKPCQQSLGIWSLVGSWLALLFTMAYAQLNQMKAAEAVSFLVIKDADPNQVLSAGRFEFFDAVGLLGYHAATVLAMCLIVGAIKEAYRFPSMIIAVVLAIGVSLGVLEHIALSGMALTNESILVAEQVRDSIISETGVDIADPKSGVRNLSNLEGIPFAQFWLMIGVALWAVSMKFRLVRAGKA